MLDQSAKYYHLTHDELIGLLLQRERELSQRDEHVQELESYIDWLLVWIMETSPTLLQISPGPQVALHTIPGGMVRTRVVPATDCSHLSRASYSHGHSLLPSPSCLCSGC